MVKNTSKKSYVKTSAANLTSKPLPGYKTARLDPVISLYSIEDFGKTEEVEEAEILFIHDSSLAASNQNLVKRKFSYINTLYHEVPAVGSAMRDLTSGVFENL